MGAASDPVGGHDAVDEQIERQTFYQTDANATARLVIDERGLRGRSRDVADRGAKTAMHVERPFRAAIEVGLDPAPEEMRVLGVESGDIHHVRAGWDRGIEGIVAGGWLRIARDDLPKPRIAEIGRRLIARRDAVHPSSLGKGADIVAMSRADAARGAAAIVVAASVADLLVGVGDTGFRIGSGFAELGRIVLNRGGASHAEAHIGFLLIVAAKIASPQQRPFRRQAAPAMSRKVGAAEAHRAAAAVSATDLFVEPDEGLGLQLVDQRLSHARLGQRQDRVDKSRLRGASRGQLLHTTFGNVLGGANIRGDVLRHDTGAGPASPPISVFAHIMVSAGGTWRRRLDANMTAVRSAEIEENAAFCSGQIASRNSSGTLGTSRGQVKSGTNPVQVQIPADNIRRGKNAGGSIGDDGADYAALADGLLEVIGDVGLGRQYGREGERAERRRKQAFPFVAAEAGMTCKKMHHWEISSNRA